MNINSDSPGRELGLEAAVTSNSRDSIWSVSAGYWMVYFTLFALLTLAGMSFVAWYQATQRNEATTFDIIYGSIQDLAVVGVGSAIISFIVTEGTRILMVISNYLIIHLLKPAQEKFIARGEARGEAQGRVKGRAEALAEAALQVEDWNRRRLEAAARGESFDEPPPDLTGP